MSVTPLGRIVASSHEWLAEEEQRLRAGSGPSSVAAYLVRRRRPVLVVVYAAVALLSQGLNGPGGDSGVFTAAGRVLLSRRWTDTFADAQVQSGPVFLLMHGVGSLLTAGTGLPFWFGGGLVTSVVVGLLVSVAARACFTGYGLPAEEVAVRELAVGLVFALTGGLWLVATYAHPDDVIVVLVLLIAACQSALGRPTAAGLLFGLAIGVKLWAVVAVGVLLVRASRRGSSRAVLAVGATLLLVYGPFFAFGHVHTFDWIWQAEDPAPMSLFVASGTNVTWSLRLAQAACATVVGLAAVWRSYGSRSAVWVVPAAAVAGRLLLDPRGLVYYYPPLLLCLLLGQWAAGRSSPFVTCLTSVTWVVATVGVFVVATHTVGSLWVATFCTGVVVLALRNRRTGRRHPTSRPT